MQLQSNLVFIEQSLSPQLIFLRIYPLGFFYFLDLCHLFLSTFHPFFSPSILTFFLPSFCFSLFEINLFEMLCKFEDYAKVWCNYNGLMNLSRETTIAVSYITIKVNNSQDYFIISARLLFLRLFANSFSINLKFCRFTKIIEF